MNKKKALELLKKIDKLKAINIELEEKRRSLFELKYYFKELNDIESFPRYIGFMNGAELGLMALLSITDKNDTTIAKFEKKLDDAGYPYDGKIVSAKDLVKLI